MRALLLLLCAGAAACGGDPPSCPQRVFPSSEPLPPGADGFALAVGREDEGHAHVATPWQDGDRVGLVTGGQGGWMIRPAVDITTPARLDELEGRYACVGVRMTAAVAGGAPVVIVSVAAERQAATPSTYHVTPLFGLLGFDRTRLDGVSTPLRFDVLTDGGDGGTAVTVVPDATLPP